MATKDDVGGSSEAERRGVGAPLAITIFVVLGVGAAYFAYYRKQVAYYTGRNLRLLSMLTAQVDGRVDMYAGFTAKRQPLAGLEIPKCEPATDLRADDLRRSVIEGTHGWNLKLQDPVPSNCAATVSLDDALRPILARRVGAAFDVLLVADSNGKVLYSIRPPPNSPSFLRREDEADDVAETPVAMLTDSATAAQTSTADSGKKKSVPAKKAPPSRTTGDVTDRESGSEIQLASLTALLQRTGWRQYETLKPAALALGTGHLDVSLQDTDYILFSQPYIFSRGGSLAPNAKPDPASQWIVCGLVSASRFRYDVSAISTTIILIAIAIALLALCCWPFLRIALIDPSQALTITDVVLLIFCTIAGAAVITLTLLAGFAYAGISRSADEQLRKFTLAVNDDFARNVSRAMGVLLEAEKLSPAWQTPPLQLGSQALPDVLTKTAAVHDYPYIESIALIDIDGMQRIRLSHDENGARYNVSSRRYFQEAVQGKAALVSGPHTYALEWVRSMSTGEVRAVVAKKTDAGPYPVISLATELIDVSHAVRPPGVDMAIIDENGEVIYHSDVQRIGYENFFAEADRDRELRSAVVARRAGFVSATYWGEDESMFVMPLSGTGWTLVSFRARRLTRVMNVEAALLTLLMLLLSAMPYFLTYIGVLLVAPRYRAPRLWPEPARWHDYLHLSIILLTLLALFALNNYILTPWSSFAGVVLIPFIAIVSAYLVLHRTGAPRRFAIATALWLVANAILIAHIALGNIDSELFFSEHQGTTKAALILATLGVATLTMLLLAGRRVGKVVAALGGKLQERVSYGTLYRLCGALLLAIGAALPVVGFFTISRHVESELLVKYGQLRAVINLEHRIDHLQTLSVLPGENPPAVTRDLLFNRLNFMFDTRWTLHPPVPTGPYLKLEEEEKPCAQKKEDTDSDWTIPPWAAGWLPTLYEDSVAIRPLFEGESIDKLWVWNRSCRLIKLKRTIRFDSDVGERLWHTPNPRNEQWFVIDSHLPQSSFGSSPAESDSKAPYGGLMENGVVRFSVMSLLALALMGVFWYAAHFVAKRVLLIDVREPDWVAPLPLSPTLGDHIFLVRRERDTAELTTTAPRREGIPVLDVSFQELDESDTWAGVLQQIDSSVPGRNVRVRDFEYAIDDGHINEKKLQWLERLLALPDRTVIVVSTVSPAFVMTTPPPPAAIKAGVLWYFDRWRAMLDRFICVTAEELQLRTDEWKRRKEFRTVSQIRPQTWLEKETEYNGFLRRLRGELDPTADRNQLLDELAERAETYFAGLWASCREEEKLLLFHLANNGLANGRNRRTLRRLMARGLVRRDPNLELFSETFRLYVLTAARREDLASRARAQRPASTWDALRLPFFVVIISFLLLLFATQKDLLTTTTAFATALTTGLPVLMKLIGTFTQRRMGGDQT